MTQWLVRISWPAKPLWQNRPYHWAKRAKAVKAYREEAWAMAREQAVRTDPSATLEFTFHPPDNRRRDVQNMPATMKSGIDGIADAMGCDDSKFCCVWPTEFAQTVKGGCVLIHIKSSAT